MRTWIWRRRSQLPNLQRLHLNPQQKRTVLIPRIPPVTVLMMPKPRKKVEPKAVKAAEEDSSDDSSSDSDSDSSDEDEDTKMTTKSAPKSAVKTVKAVKVVEDDKGSDGDDESS